MYQRETLELHGAFPDLIPQDAPLIGWNSVNNVYFQNGETRRTQGNTPVFGTPTTTPLAIVFYTNGNGENFWVWASDTEIIAIGASGPIDITPANWTSVSGTITIITFNGLVIVNDAAAGPFYWSGASSDVFEPLPNWPTGWRCVSLRSHKAFLLAIGRLDASGVQRVNWSDAAEAGSLPTSWEAAADNLAGFADLLPAASPCVDGFTIGDDFLVFKGESVHALTFVGGNAVFNVRKRFNDIGIAGLDGWCRGPNEQALFFGSDGDIYLTEGLSYRSILDGIAQQTYYAEADPEQLTRVCAGTLFRVGLSILAYPTVGSAHANRAIVYDWNSGELGFRDMPQVTCLAQGRYLQDITPNEWDAATGKWDTDPESWNQSLVPATADDLIGGAAAAFYWLSGTTGDTIPLPAYALKQGLSFGNAKKRKQIARIWPKLAGQAGDVVRFRIGGQDTTHGSTAWASPVDYVIGSEQAVDTFVQGRYMAIEVSSTIGEPWRLGSIDVEFRPVGNF